MSASYGSSEALALSYHRGPVRAGSAGAMVSPVLSVPDLFLYSMSKPVMMLFPSNRWVQRRFMLRAFTSRISSSGGSGGSGVWWGRVEVRMAAESLSSCLPPGMTSILLYPWGLVSSVVYPRALEPWDLGKLTLGEA